jgi:hypothetical protein
MPELVQDDERGETREGEEIRKHVEGRQPEGGSMIASAGLRRAKLRTNGGQRGLLCIMVGPIKGQLVAQTKAENAPQRVAQ